ncbi:MAG: hypothetical protein LBE50_04595 [Gallionellaceae bacterium]|jgi:hypothetical protein|nr:hypothetical protein [Gallionellaceae bacterium]
MRITREVMECLKRWHNVGMVEWFLRRFPEGEAEYQDVLNAAAADGESYYAYALMKSIKSETTIEVDAITDCKHFFAAGNLVIKTSAIISGKLYAGGSIQAGEDITAKGGIWTTHCVSAGKNINTDSIEADRIVAGGYIKADGPIRAEWEITAGDYIKAGGVIEALQRSDSSRHVGIKAGTYIKGEYIKAVSRIEAGTDITASDLIEGDYITTGLLRYDTNDEENKTGGDIVSRGDIQARSTIKAGGNIKAGRDIKAGDNILAWQGIDAGEAIEAIGGIRASTNIKAGGKINVGHAHAGTDIEAEYDIVCGSTLEAGRNLESGGDIKAGAIDAGGNIEARGSILSGSSITGAHIEARIGIFAGLNERRESWPTRAKVTAATKPDNLNSGFWVEPEDPNGELGK